jgi:hypothetical protein
VLLNLILGNIVNSHDQVRTASRSDGFGILIAVNMERDALTFNAVQFAEIQTVRNNIPPPYSARKSKPKKETGRSIQQVELSSLRPLLLAFRFAFDREDGVDKFLRIVGLCPNYTAVQPGTMHHTIKRDTGY